MTCCTACWDEALYWQHCAECLNRWMGSLFFYMANTCLGFVMIDLDGVIKEDWLALSEDKHDSLTIGPEEKLDRCLFAGIRRRLTLSLSVMCHLLWYHPFLGLLCVCSCLVSFSPFSLSWHLTMRLICVCVSLALFLSPDVFLIATFPRLSQPVCISSSTSDMQNRKRNPKKKKHNNHNFIQESSLPLRYSCRTWQHNV